ncbi:MAG: hypothetical protein ACYDDD_06840 [Acidithiobacillus ferrivorans]
MSQSETQTRSELIDQQLAQSGWNVKDPTQVVDGAADDVHESLLSEVSRVVPSPTRLRITSPRAMAIQPMPSTARVICCPPRPV